MTSAEFRARLNDALRLSDAAYGSAVLSPLRLKGPSSAHYGTTTTATYGGYAYGLSEEEAKQEAEEHALPSGANIKTATAQPTYVPCAPDHTVDLAVGSSLATLSMLQSSISHLGQRVAKVENALSSGRNAVGAGLGGGRPYAKVDWFDAFVEPRGGRSTDEVMWIKNLVHDALDPIRDTLRHHERLLMDVVSTVNAAVGWGQVGRLTMVAGHAKKVSDALEAAAPAVPPRSRRVGEGQQSSRDTSPFSRRHAPFHRQVEGDNEPRRFGDEVKGGAEEEQGRLKSDGGSGSSDAYLIDKVQRLKRLASDIRADVILNPEACGGGSSSGGRAAAGTTESRSVTSNGGQQEKGEKASSDSYSTASPPPRDREDIRRTAAAKISSGKGREGSITTPSSTVEGTRSQEMGERERSSTTTTTTGTSRSYQTTTSGSGGTTTTTTTSTSTAGGKEVGQRASSTDTYNTYTTLYSSTPSEPDKKLAFKRLVDVNGSSSSGAEENENGAGVGNAGVGNHDANTSALEAVRQIVTTANDRQRFEYNTSDVLVAPSAIGASRHYSTNQPSSIVNVGEGSGAAAARDPNNNNNSSTTTMSNVNLSRDVSIIEPGGRGGGRGREEDAVATTFKTSQRIAAVRGGVVGSSSASPAGGAGVGQRSVHFAPDQTTFMISYDSTRSSDREGGLLESEGKGMLSSVSSSRQQEQGAFVSTSRDFPLGGNTTAGEETENTRLGRSVGTTTTAAVSSLSSSTAATAAATSEYDTTRGGGGLGGVSIMRPAETTIGNTMYMTSLVTVDPSVTRASSDDSSHNNTAASIVGNIDMALLRREGANRAQRRGYSDRGETALDEDSSEHSKAYRSLVAQLQRPSL